MVKRRGVLNAFRLHRAEKSEVLSEDLQSVEKRVDVVRQAYTSTTKKIAATLQSTGPDAEKRLKKLPEMGIAHSMLENAQLLGTDSVMGSLFQLCGESESNLAKELVQYEVEVERDVLGPLTNVLEVDIPQIMKLKKQLSRVTLDMDSARSRWTAAVRQAQVHGTNMAQAAAKADQIKDEMEDASNRVEMGKDALASEMFNFVAKEAEYSQKLVEFVAAQSRYHERALETLNEILPKMRTCLDANPNKPVYGQLLSEHLQVTERDIALPIEACVCTLLEVGLDEEGLFRIGGMASRVKKLKSAFDAGIVDMEEYQIDVHAIAGCLKLYLRELPEPLLTFELYQEFMNAVSLPADQRLQALWVTVRKLPQDNYVNLRYLCKFLARLAEKSDVNKMTPSNIAIVIGPNLLWAQDEASPNMLSTGHLSTLAEAFVMHVDYFFPEDVDFAVSTGESSPHSLRQPTHSPVPSRSETVVINNNSTPQPVSQQHSSSSLSSSSSQPSPPVTTKGDHTPPTTHQSSTAPLATAERTVSPKVARRAGKKAAPPPPPDRPHSVAIPPAVSSEKPHSVPRHISPPADVILEDEKSKSLPPPRPHGPPPDRPPSYTGEKPERPKLPPPPAEKPGGHQRSLSTGSTTTRVIVPAPGPQSAGLSGLYPNLDLELGEKDKDSAAAVSLVTQKPPCSGQDNVPNRLVTGMSTFNSGSSCNNEVMASSGSGHTILTNAVTTNSNVLSPGPPIPPVRHGSTRLTRPTPPPPPPPVSHADEETRL